MICLLDELTFIVAGISLAESVLEDGTFEDDGALVEGNPFDEGICGHK